MPFVPAPNCIKAVINWFADGKNWYNTLWFWNSAGWTMAEGETFADVIFLWAEENFLPFLPSSVSLSEVVVYDMDTEDSWVVASTVPSAAGDLGGTLASLASCMTVTFRTSRRGRSYRGRNYVTGFQEADVGARTFVAGLVTNIGNAYEALPSALLGTGGQHVVVSYYNNNVAREIAEHTPVVDYDAHSTIYRQGKRTH